MKHLKFEIASENFHSFRSTRIQQGEISAGPEPQSTILRSCISIGFFEPKKRIGAISHITGFSPHGLHSAPGALAALRKELHKLGVEFSDCECFIVGGADSSRHVYEDARAELERQGLSFDELDVLGTVHRKILLDPAQGMLHLYKKTSPQDLRRLVSTAHAETAGPEFHDPKARITTGASMFFRNRGLVDFICNGNLEELVSRTQRLHIWCAGCSVGVEVYSMAMVVLDWLATREQPVDFRILGTDISDEALDTAILGEYPVTGHMSSTHDALLTKYVKFTNPRHIRVGPELRRVAVFKQRDIREGSRAHRFELVVCDHVLQYFPDDEQNAFISSLCNALLPGGYLYVSTPSLQTRELLSTRYRLQPVQRHLFRKRS